MCIRDRLKAALAHEKYVTELINNIYAAALEDHDYRTMQLLDWFVKEQGEEEKSATDMVTKMELFGSDMKSLYMLNNELKSRVYAAPDVYKRQLRYCVSIHYTLIFSVICNRR